MFSFSEQSINSISKKFNIEEVHQGIRNKLEVLESIISKYNLSEEEYLYIGDDVNDYDSLTKTKYAITVPNAVSKVKSIDNIMITTSCGGDGAFREVVDSLIY